MEVGVSAKRCAVGGSSSRMYGCGSLQRGCVMGEHMSELGGSRSSYKRWVVDRGGIQVEGSMCMGSLDVRSSRYEG